MSIFSIVGIAIAAAALAALLRQYRQDYAMMVGLAAGVLIFALILSKAQPAFSEINRLMSGTRINTAYISILIKSLGICFVVQLASDACRDAGESAIASKVELAGKFAVLLVALPLFDQVAALVLSLISSQ
jgi:Stage III sporulation protein AC/AD protein family.